jgi:hypothetical protein
MYVCAGESPKGLINNLLTNVMKYEPSPFSDLKKLHLVDPGAFLHSFRWKWVFLIVAICTLMPASNAVAQG